MAGQGQRHEDALAHGHEVHDFSHRMCRGRQRSALTQYLPQRERFDLEAPAVELTFSSGELR
jgi:hypothetical protein